MIGKQFFAFLLMRKIFFDRKVRKKIYEHNEKSQNPHPDKNMVDALVFYPEPYDHDHDGPLCTRPTC
jgi:hypothetical protein